MSTETASRKRDREDAGNECAHPTSQLNIGLLEKSSHLEEYHSRGNLIQIPTTNWLQDDRMSRRPLLKRANLEDVDT